MSTPMPSTESESKIKTTVYLSQELLDLIASIGKIFGLNPGETLRIAVIDGLTVLAEKANKVSVHKKLKRDAEQIDIHVEPDGE